MKSKEYVATHHGRERLLERMKCAPGKIDKVLRKAWNSTEQGQLSNWREYVNAHKEESKDMFVRSFCGYVFIFRTMLGADGGTIQKVLITVYNPKEFWNPSFIRKELWKRSTKSPRSSSPDAWRTPSRPSWTALSAMVKWPYEAP